MKQGNVIVQANLVVFHWELIPMESGDEFLAPQDTDTEETDEDSTINHDDAALY